MNDKPSAGRGVVTLDTNAKDDRLVVLSFFRYCIGRRTYMPGVFQAFVRREHRRFTDEFVTELLRDLGREIKPFLAGASEYSDRVLGHPEIDAPRWLFFFLWFAGVGSDRITIPWITAELIPILADAKVKLQDQGYDVDIDFAQLPSLDMLPRAPTY